MTRMQWSRTVSLAAVLALMIACNSSSAPEGPAPVAVVTVSPQAQSLVVGQQLTLRATPKDALGDEIDRPVSWASENLEIATVTAAGVVRAIAPGVVDIHATSEGRRGTARLTVNPESEQPPPPPAVAEVRLSVDDAVELAWNGTMQLSAVALDAQGNVLEDREVRWLTSMASVVTVSSAGMLQAVAPGYAMVSAVIEGIASSVGVYVKRAPAVEVVLDVGTTGLEIGETVFYGARVKRASGQVEAAYTTWVSSAPTVATVHSNEQNLVAVEALAEGQTTITATIEGISASVMLRITPKPTHDLTYSRWSGTQSELFVLSLGTIGATPIRLNAGNVSRDPSPSPDGSQLVFSVSQELPDGTNQNDLYIVNRNGMNMRRLTSAAGLEDMAAWSPDGTRIAFRGTNDEATRSDIWVINVDGTGLTNLTGGRTDLAGIRDPAWSPDGSRIAFVAAQVGHHKVWIMNADGSNATQFTTDVGFDISPTWSPSGDRLAFARYNTADPSKGWDIMIAPLAGGAPQRLALAGDQVVPAWSPDGQYIAVAGTAVAGTGAQQVYTLRPDGTGLRLRTVNAEWGGGSAPSWITRQ